MKPSNHPPKGSSAAATRSGACLSAEKTGPMPRGRRFAAVAVDAGAVAGGAAAVVDATPRRRGAGKPFLSGSASSEGQGKHMERFWFWT